MFDLITIGEPLIQLNSVESGPIRHVTAFERHVAGSETNIAIGISRLGLRTSLVTKIGRDELSRCILSTLRSEGVDTTYVEQVADKNCGIFFVQRNYPIPGKSDVIYYRSDSAVTLLSAKDLPDKAIAGSKALHLSGITPALSTGCREACFRAIEVARENGVTISFDPNYRKKLWSPAKARPVLTEMASKCDILFLDREDAALVLGASSLTTEQIITSIGRLGPKTVVVKLGPTHGILARSSDGERAASRPPSVLVEDSIGAGDAVVAGFMAGYLYGEKLQKSLDMASACAALVVMRKGDFENLPDRGYLEVWFKAREKGFDLDPR